MAGLLACGGTDNDGTDQFVGLWQFGFADFCVFAAASATVVVGGAGRARTFVIPLAGNALGVRINGRLQPTRTPIPSRSIRAT
jgi:hypothetical protein